MREIPRPYERYRHFKGKDYQIITTAKSADDLRDLVVYQALYEPYEIYVRDLEEFLSPVDKSRYPEVTQEERFRKLTADGAAEIRKDAAPRRDTAERAPSEAEKTAPEEPASVPVRHETPGERAKKQKPEIDPVLLRFLDAETDDAKLTVLSEVRDLLTPALLTPMELSLGMEPQEEVDQDIRFKQIRNTLQYKQKYERSRRG